MLFNPLFIQPSQPVDKGVLPKSAKLNKTSYLFSDIIKVFHLSSQLKGETVGDNTTGDAKLLNSFLEKLKGMKGISWNKAADGSITFNLNGSTDLLEFIKNIFSGDSGASVNKAGLLVQDGASDTGASLQKLFATKEDFIGFLNQFLTKIAVSDNGSTAAASGSNNGKDTKTSKADSAALEAIVASILLNNQATLNLNFGDKQLKIDIVKSAPDQNIHDNLAGYNFTGTAKSSPAGLINISVNGTDNNTQGALGQLLELGTPADIPKVLSVFKMNLATSAESAAADKKNPDVTTAAADNTSGKPAASQLMSSGKTLDPKIAAELKTVADMGGIKNLKSLKSAVENALTGNKNNNNSQTAAQNTQKNGGNTTLNSAGNPNKTAGTEVNVNSELKNIGELKPIVESVSTEKTDSSTPLNKTVDVNVKQSVPRQTTALNSAGNPNKTAGIEANVNSELKNIGELKPIVESVSTEKTDSSTPLNKTVGVKVKHSVPGKTTAELAVETVFPGKEKTLKTVVQKHQADNVTAGKNTDPGIKSEIKSVIRENIKNQITVKPNDSQPSDPSKNNDSTALAGGDKAAAAERSNTTADVKSNNQNNTGNAQQGAEGKSSVASGGENLPGGFNDTLKRDGNKESFDRPQTPVMQAGSVIGKNGATKPVETFIPNHTELPVKAVNAADILKEISNFIEKGDKSSIVLKLRPESLGKIRIALDVVDKAVHAHLQVDNNTVRQIVQSNMNDLRQTLAAAGLQLSSFDVALSGSDHKHAKNFGAKKKFGHPVSGNSTDEEAELTVSKSMGYNTYEYLI